MQCSHCGRDEGYHYPPVVLGAHRTADNPRAVVIMLNRDVTDDDLHSLPRVLRWYGVRYLNDCRHEPPR
jgi:hypothetical protein